MTTHHTSIQLFSHTLFSLDLDLRSKPCSNTTTCCQLSPVCSPAGDPPTSMLKWWHPITLQHLQVYNHKASRRRVGCNNKRTTHSCRSHPHHRLSSRYLSRHLMMTDVLYRGDVPHIRPYPWHPTLLEWDQQTCSCTSVQSHCSNNHNIHLTPTTFTCIPHHNHPQTHPPTNTRRHTPTPSN